MTLLTGREIRCSKYRLDTITKLIAVATRRLISGHVAA